MDATGQEMFAQITASNEASQAFQAAMMMEQNKHQTIMSSYKAQKEAYAQIKN